ncbi:hypothetical protein BGZ63DRAFT_367629, partial [Mariannaea sp. PMI_226]
KGLRCEHYYILVGKWCETYRKTGIRCPTNIVSKQYWGDDICSACQERQDPRKTEWSHLIQRRGRN